MPQLMSLPVVVLPFPLLIVPAVVVVVFLVAGGGGGGSGDTTYFATELVEVMKGFQVMPT